MARPVRALAGLLWRRVDDDMVDRFVNGMVAFLARRAEELPRIQTGLVASYVPWFLQGR